MRDLAPIVRAAHPATADAPHRAIARLLRGEESELAPGLALTDLDSPLIVRFPGIDQAATARHRDPWRALFSAIYLAVDDHAPCGFGAHARVDRFPAGTTLRQGRVTPTAPILRLSWSVEPLISETPDDAEAAADRAFGWDTT